MLVLISFKSGLNLCVFCQQDTDSKSCQQLGLAHSPYININYFSNNDGMTTLCTEERYKTAKVVMHLDMSIFINMVFYYINTLLHC